MKRLRPEFTRARVQTPLAVHEERELARWRHERASGLVPSRSFPRALGVVQHLPLDIEPAQSFQRGRRVCKEPVFDVGAEPPAVHVPAFAIRRRVRQREREERPAVRGERREGVGGDDRIRMRCIGIGSAPAEDEALGGEAHRRVRRRRRRRIVRARSEPRPRGPARAHHQRRPGTDFVVVLARQEHQAVVVFVVVVAAGVGPLVHVEIR